MVNELKELMRQNVAAPPPDDLDLSALVGLGRRRVRRRRTAVVGGVAAVVAVVVAGTVVSWPQDGARTGLADRPPAPDAPTIGLADADRAVEGRDYRVVTSHTNDDLDNDNGQYLDGVTDDGLILFRDGPRADQLYPRMALVDPATEEKDWLPDLDIGQAQTWPVQLGVDRLVLIGADSPSDDVPDPGDGPRLVLSAFVFDRATRQWSTVTWPSLPDVRDPHAVVGPDDRLYVFVPAKTGKPPAGGWPTGPDGEADDSDAEGSTYHLWSVSFTDGSDARDEGMTVGDLAFTDSSMVWTDSSNGAAGLVHVRDLATGAEHSFDPHAGEKCNLLSFGATDDRVVLSQYCGTYAAGVRDDRVQILTTAGDQVVTIQDSGIDGSVGYLGGRDLVTLSAYGPDGAGTYVYDLGTNQFLQVSDAMSSWSSGGPTPDGMFFSNTPVNSRHGSTQTLGELLR